VQTSAASMTNRMFWGSTCARPVPEEGAVSAYERSVHCCPLPSLCTRKKQHPQLRVPDLFAQPIKAAGPAAPEVWECIRPTTRQSEFSAKRPRQL